MNLGALNPRALLFVYHYSDWHLLCQGDRDAGLPDLSLGQCTAERRNVTDKGERVVTAGVRQFGKRYGVADIRAAARPMAVGGAADA